MYCQDKTSWSNQLQWNPDFFNLRGKWKLAWKLLVVWEIGVKIKAFDWGERSNFWVIRRFEKSRVPEIRITQSVSTRWQSTLLIINLYLTTPPLHENVHECAIHRPDKFTKKGTFQFAKTVQLTSNIFCETRNEKRKILDNNTVLQSVKHQSTGSYRYM